MNPGFLRVGSMKLKCGDGVKISLLLCCCFHHQRRLWRLLCRAKREQIQKTCTFSETFLWFITLVRFRGERFCRRQRPNYSVSLTENDKTGLSLVFFYGKLKQLNVKFCWHFFFCLTYMLTLFRRIRKRFHSFDVSTNIFISVEICVSIHQILFQIISMYQRKFVPSYFAITIRLSISSSQRFLII